MAFVPLVHGWLEAEVVAMQALETELAGTARRKLRVSGRDARGRSWSWAWEARD